VSLPLRRPPFYIPSWCGLHFACASTSCTLCSRFEIRRTRVCHLGVWSLQYAFRSCQIFQTQSPAHGSQIHLAFKLSWSLMPSYNTRLKALFLSLHQISPQQLHHHHLRLCLPLLTLRLLLHSSWLPCQLFSGKSILLGSVSSRARLTSENAWNIIIHSWMMMMMIEFLFFVVLILFSEQL
jgi:hypothetical protein